MLSNGQVTKTQSTVLYTTRNHLYFFNIFLKAMYTQFLKKQYTVYPTQSLTLNIGHDGTGIHCGASNRFDVKLSTKTEFSFPANPTVDLRLVRANRVFRDGNRRKILYSRFMDKARRLTKRHYD